MQLETKNDLDRATIEALQELIQINRESERGFREAAERVSEESLARLFQRLADDRAGNAADLGRYVVINGESIQAEGSYLESLHRAWIAIRSALTANDSHALLREAERGEDHIKHAYEDVLKRTAGSAMNDVLNSQYGNVKAGHDRIRDLRDRCKG